MKLVEMEIKKYLEVLASNAPAPGGGSVSALASAQGVALFVMVADLTIGKEKFKDFEEICKEVKEKGVALQEKLTDAVDRDTEAFNLVAAAFKMPKATDEEKKLRSKAIGEGTIASTEVPYEVMQMSLEALKLAEKLVDHSNPNAASDLGVAAQNLGTGIKGAWLNVKINVPGIKDQELAESFVKGGEAMIKESEEISNRVYESIVRSL